MHTKFRPIITESVRKPNSTYSESTESISTKLVKPIPVSAWSKPEIAVPPLPFHETDNGSFPQLNHIPLINGLTSARDKQDSDISFGKQDASLYSHKSPVENATHTTDTFKSAKKARSLGIPVVAGSISTSDYNVEVGDANGSESSYLHELEKGRPESGHSQEQIDMKNSPHSSMEKETDLNSVSNTSGDLSKTEREIPDTLRSGQQKEERIVCKTKFEIECDPELHAHLSDRLDKNLAIYNGTTANEVKKSAKISDYAQATQDENNSSRDVPQFSDVLESEDSSQSDPQGHDARKLGRQDPLTPFSSPSSSTESYDRNEASSSPKMRKTSSGSRVSLRRLERKQSSSIASGDSNENPWFDDRSTSKHENEDAEHSSNESETSKPEKEKKRRTNRFRRLFRSTKSDEIYKEDDSMLPSAGDLALRVSVSDDSSVPTEDVNPSEEASEEHLQETLSLAVSGKRNLEEVIDALLGLSGRPCDKVMKLLMKYMCSTIVIDEAFRLILEHEHAKKADIPMKSMAPSHARYSPHREALINLFANGPERLKKALLNHNKARSEILRFFTDKRPEGDAELPYWISTATSLSKILNGLLAQFPADLSEYIGGKKGVLHLMVKNHVHVPEVVEFVIQLSAANALSKTTGEDLRYGAANATGLVLLVKEGICDLLVDIFRKSSSATAQGNAHLLEWQTQVMSTQCLLELSKRATVIPRFTKDNCSYSGRYIKTLNSALDELSLFAHDDRVLSLLNSGFDAVSDGPEIENVREQSERNNPLVCTLAVITELLETVRIAAGSKLAVTRKTVGSTNTGKIEKHLVSKMARLCKLLHRRSAHDVSPRAKVAIVNVFRCLCSSKIETTRQAMVKSQIPDRLMILIRENEGSNILHSCVLKCLSASFSSPQSIELHKEWLRALARSEGWLQVMYEYFHKVKGGAGHGRKQYFSTFVEIGFCLVDFCQDNKAAKLRPMLKTKTELQTFVDSIEAGLLRMRKDYETSCGGPKPEERVVSVLANAETLAARLHDFNAV